MPSQHPPDPPSSRPVSPTDRKFYLEHLLHQQYEVDGPFAYDFEEWLRREAADDRDGSLASIVKELFQLRESPMPRWYDLTSKQVTCRRVERFIDEIEDVCKRHGFAISHQDGHGAFIIESYHPHLLGWLGAAHIGNTVPPSEVEDAN